MNIFLIMFLSLLLKCETYNINSIIHQKNNLNNFIKNKYKNKKMVDIGCGVGLLTLPYYPCGSMGVDSKYEDIKIARHLNSNKLFYISDLSYFGGYKNFDSSVLSETLSKNNNNLKILENAIRISNDDIIIHDKIEILLKIKYLYKSKCKNISYDLLDNKYGILLLNII